MSNLPSLFYLGPLKIVMSRKSMEMLDTSEEYWIADILLLQWETKLFISLMSLSSTTS